MARGRKPKNTAEAAVEEVKNVAENAAKAVKEAAEKAAPAAEKAAKKVAKTAQAKKDAVKKAVAEIKDTYFIQYGDKEVDVAAVAEACKADYKSKGHRTPKSVTVYIKPEEGAAYYTVNGKGSEDFKVEL
jgi:predicted HAD superfamily Cof-like phosphohydrolase